MYNLSDGFIKLWIAFIGMKCFFFLLHCIVTMYPVLKHEKFVPSYGYCAMLGWLSTNIIQCIIFYFNDLGRTVFNMLSDLLLVAIIMIVLHIIALKRTWR